jgi:Flp pilus assembly pilin Flp
MPGGPLSRCRLVPRLATLVPAVDTACTGIFTNARRESSGESHEGITVTRNLRAIQGRTERGASAVEYALLVVAIALILVAGAWALGTAIRDRLNESATCVDSAPTAAGCDTTTP